MDIKAENIQDSSANIYLGAAVVLANMDYTDLADYAIRAAIGGFIWMGFKLAGDWISKKIKKGGKP